jgi:hypothetical protein
VAKNNEKYQIKCSIFQDIFNENIK